MNKRMMIILISLSLTGCADAGSNIGRATLAVGTLGMSEFAIARKKERSDAIQQKCAQFKGMDNIKCISMLSQQPPEPTRVIVPQPVAVDNGPAPMPMMHCDTMNMGGGMASTNCM